jgi:hypothetical protein
MRGALTWRVPSASATPAVVTVFCPDSAMMKPFLDV